MQKTVWDPVRCQFEHFFLECYSVSVASSMEDNWKLAQVVNSHLCDPTIWQQGFDLPREQGLYWTIFALNRDTAVPAEGNGDLQTLICVLVVRPRRCPTLSNPVPWQYWMAAYLGYTLFLGWPVMVHDMHTRRRGRSSHIFVHFCLRFRFSFIAVLCQMNYWWMDV